jgi:CHAT domain-containing protein
VAVLEAALEAERVGLDHLRYTVRSLPERQSLAYAVRRPRGLDLAISMLISTGGRDVGRVLDAVVRSRTVVLEELASRSAVVSAADPTLTTLTARVSAARARFANLILRSLAGDEAVPRALLDAVRQDKEELERALAEQSDLARSEADRAEVGLDEVRRVLPPDTALVSYVRYERTRLVAAGPASRPVVAPAYAAFVVSPSHSEGTVVSIGAAAAVDELISAWRSQTGGATLGTADPLEAERQVRASGIRLRQRIWDPIASQLGGANRVFIVPDGALNLVSFPALPIEKWRYLVERGPVLHLVTAERDLIPPLTAVPGRGLLAVGGAAYGQGGDTSGARPSVPPGCEPAAFRFEDLPGTRGEVQEIARLWTLEGRRAEGSEPSVDVTVLSGSAATKAAVVSGFAGKRVIHLATHGFFVGGPCESKPLLTRSVGGLVAAGRRVIDVEDNPLLTSGLVFAGVNQRRPQSRSDGILTAEEVASLNLQGTEWAVLSACDTGLGQIRAGEGVLGLRRAFQIAGARTVIMSLWAVSDESARSWMRALYEERFQRGASTAEAVRRAHVRSLQARRARGQSTHPFYWAAFVAAGDWN